MKEAEEAVDRTPPDYLEASIHLPKAIEALRRIGGSQERIDELHRRLLDYQGRSLTEMKSASAEFDASEHIEQVRAHIKGKTLEEALLTLARMGASPKVVDLRNRVQELARQFPLQHLMPVVIVNQDGKVIERVIAGIRAEKPQITESELRQELFLRYYGDEFSPEQRKKILAAIADYWRRKEAAQDCVSVVVGRSR